MKKKIQLSFISLISLVFIGCATQPLYYPAKNSDSIGYFETRLTEDRYRITFNGRSSTSNDTVKNLALLRAAEVTIKNGYDWFEIIDRENDQSKSNSRGPRVGVSVGVGSGRCFPYGCRVYGSPYYTGVRLSTSHYKDRSQSVLEIFMGKGEPEDPTKVYDARELEKRLSDQSRLP